MISSEVHTLHTGFQLFQHYTHTDLLHHTHNGHLYHKWVNTLEQPQLQEETKGLHKMKHYKPNLWHYVTNIRLTETHLSELLNRIYWYVYKNFVASIYIIFFMHNLVIKQLSDIETPSVLMLCMISGNFINLHCISQLTKLILTFIHSIFILIYFIEKRVYYISFRSTSVHYVCTFN